MEEENNNRNKINNTDANKRINDGKKRNKHNIKERSFENTFNFKNGELYNRINYLNLLSNTLNSKNPELSRIYVKQMKKIKQRNSLKINKSINSKICNNCNSLFDVNKNNNLSVHKINNKLCYLIECHECKYIQKINLINYNIKE